LYGQTESSVNTIHIITQEQRYKKPLIGTPLDETKIFLINDAGKPVRPLQTGEIMVASKYISPGYWKKPQATEAAFMPDEELGSLYWTGDLGRLQVDGTIEFLGRRDHQVKIRGFRVEMEAIETHLLTHPAISEAVVKDHQNENGDKYLCAYVTTKNREQQPPSTRQLREYVSRELPDYMTPAFFIQL
ncbi:MAG: amino acid adenylation domain-containing protein, partial [bacterium]|nr:amino acid adenylation domain-containing protein [bacterium]